MKRKSMVWLMMCVSVFTYAALPDSLLTADKVYDLSLKDPRTAHSIVKELRQQDTMPAWKLNLLEGDCYTNQRQFRKAKALYVAALSDKTLEQDEQQHMRVLKRLVGICERLYDDDDLTNYLYQLEQHAEQTNNLYYLAHVHFINGKRLDIASDTTAIGKCLDAVELMKKSQHPNMENALFFFYGDLVQIYRNHRRFDDALRMSMLQEKTVKSMRSWREYGLYLPSMRVVYAKRAALYAEMDRHVEADRTYQLWKQSDPGKPAEDKEILPYLITAHHFDEAEQLLHDYEEYLVDEGDSLSIWMISAKAYQAIIYDLQDRDQEAIAVYNELNSLAIELHKTGSHQLMKTTYSLLQQQEKTHRRSMVINMGVVIIIVMLIGFVLLMLYIRQMSQRNKQLYTLVNGLDAYRYMAMKDNTAEEPVPVAQETENPSQEESPSNNDIYRQLFVEMDQKVTRERLFLNPDLSRDDLMALTGLDKNRFGKMMARYSMASNVSTYVSAKRAEYAAHLMKLHPDYTIAAISEMCGMSNTVTFHRNFKNLYGVTPAEYRAKLAQENAD